jgi:uncharacterized repeat protein (TIGR01451 family)
VFNDLNHSGTRDPGEGGIGGVTVELLDNMGNALAITTTAPDGSYVFAGLPPGTYSVRQTVLPGYISTTPTEVSVTLPTNGSAEVDFGNVQLPDVAITKTLDGPLTTTQGGTYIIQVANVGNGPTVGPITVTDPLAAGITLVSASGFGWNCSASTATEMECVFNAVLMGHESAPSISLRVAVDPSLLRQVIENAATVMTAFDTQPGNNSATARAPVSRPAPVPLLSIQGLIVSLGILLLIAALALRQLRAGMSQTAARVSRRR